MTPPHLSQPAFLTLCKKAIQNGWLYLNSISKQEHIMDSWLPQSVAEFSTRHMFTCGLCHWILLDKIHAGESCQSKEQRSQQELRDAVLQPLLHLCLFLFAAHRRWDPQKVLADTEGLQDTHPARAELQPCSFVLVTASSAAAALPSQRGSVILQHPTSPSLDEWSITRILLLILLLRKYSNEIYVNTLHSFYGWENKGRESCSGLITLK